MKRKIIIMTATWAISLLFIDVGLSKLMDNHSFRVQLSQSPLLKNFVDFIAIPVPLAEVIVAISILIPASRRFGLLAAWVLMLLFTGYTIYLLTYGGRLPCGCGGIFKRMSWQMHLYVNGILTLLSGAALWFSFRGHQSEIKEVI